MLRSEAQAAIAQSFTLWQQETIKITPHAHFIIACSRHIQTGAIPSEHPVRGESRMRRCADQAPSI